MESYEQPHSEEICHVKKKRAMIKLKTLKLFLEKAINHSLEFEQLMYRFSLFVNIFKREEKDKKITNE